MRFRRGQGVNQTGQMKLLFIGSQVPKEGLHAKIMLLNNVTYSNY